jgi:diadenosine tetraphosphate (Ap4A) HIT family hydrolase
MKCPFCDKKNINKQAIFKNKSVFVLYNICPANKGQCLVVPKRHVENIGQLSEKELVDLAKTVKLVSVKLKKYLKPDGLNYGFNEGEHSGQRVSHFHFHIMPRFKGDKNKLPEYHLFHRNPKKKKRLGENELGAYVEEFKKLFKK